MLLEDALDVVEGIPVFDKVKDIVPSGVNGMVNTAFFRFGHKVPALQKAYAAARAAHFEGRRYQRSAQALEH